MGTTIRRAALALFCVASSATPAVCLAAATPAETAYLRGVEHFKAGRFADAIGEFNKAYRVDPNPVLVFNMARAFEELKEYDSAVEYYRRYLQMDPQAADRAQVEQTLRTLELLQRRAAATAPLTVTSTPEGAQILVDGKPAGLTPYKGPLAVGEHFISVEKPGFQRATLKVEAVADAPIERSISLVAEPLAAAGPRDDTWAWVAIGAGGALLAGGALAGGLALKKNSDVDDIASGNTDADAAQFEHLKDQGRRLTYVADGLFVAGAASAITGIVLLVTGDPADAPTRTMLTPTAGGAQLNFTAAF